MKSNRCTTLPLVLIFCTFIDLPAVFSSPLQHRQNWAVRLETISQCNIIQRHESTLGCAGAGACPVSLGDPTKNANVRHTSHVSTVDEELYPYPTHIESESTSSVRSSRSRRTRTRHSSRTLTDVSTDDDRRVAFMISSPTVSLTTFFATIFMGPTTPLSADIDRSAHPSSILADQNSATSTVSRQNNLGVSGPLPWAAGSFCFLISFAVCLWLLRRCRRKRNAPDLSHEYVITSTESSSTLSTSNSLRSLGGDMDTELSDYPRLKGDHDPPIIIEDSFAYPASPRQSHTDQSLHGIESDVKEDRFAHIRAAPFPTKADLCRFVFPPMAAGVQREILMSEDGGVAPVPSQISPGTSTTRVLTATRPFNPQSRGILPKPFGLKPQAKPRKRLSPLGDVLYSTSGADVLETVREESPYELSQESPVVGYNEHGQTGDGSTVVVASSNAYTTVPPAGLRARRKSSPLLPSPDERFIQPPKETASPITGASEHRRGRHRRSVATVDLNCLIPINNIQPMNEEDIKFAEFVKQLTRRANLGRREHRISLLKADGGPNPKIFIPEISGDHEVHLFGKDTSPFNADYLAPPISAVNLSDFSNSSSSLSSDIGSSSSSSSVVGLAL
ncbi:hypothetical protein FRC19_004778 [Serendipita sp. 401]|nr:hypothetical protein FRC19_004778 [Serendipita sp. 401]